MLTSYPPLDYTFSNPAAARPSHHTATGESYRSLLPPSSLFESLFLPPHKDKPMQQTMLILNPEQQQRYPEPVDDLWTLMRNQEKLIRSGYYHGSLSWVDAAQMLKRCEVGTYLVRDSEHSHYLYALSVQTRKGPTSCRLDYDKGLFRLDSAEHLMHRMPGFECVTDLVEHYVEMTEYLSRKSSVMAPVWLNLDEENTRDAPVQICKPLYKQVPDLQLLCCKSIVRRLRERYETRTLSRSTLLADSEYRSLPKILQNYLDEYLFPTQDL